MRSIIYLDAAGADLRAIALYIAEDNPARAKSFVDELRKMVSKVAERPMRFPARFDLTPGLRVARHGRYLIFFLHDADRIEVVRVLHGARDLARHFASADEQDSQA